MNAATLLDPRLLRAMGPDVEVVHQQDVDPVGAEPVQAVLDRAHDAVVAVVVDLGERQRALRTGRGRGCSGGAARAGGRPWSTARSCRAAGRAAPRRPGAPTGRSRRAARYRTGGCRRRRQARTVASASASENARYMLPSGAPPKPSWVTARPDLPSTRVSPGFMASPPVALRDPWAPAAGSGRPDRLSRTIMRRPRRATRTRRRRCRQGASGTGRSMMYTKQALRALGVTGEEFTDEQRRALDRDGFFIVPDYFSPEQCRQMAEEFDRLHAAEGDRGGHEVHVEPGAPRVSNIFNKTDAYDACLECKPFLAASPLSARRVQGPRRQSARSAQGPGPPGAARRRAQAVRRRLVGEQRADAVRRHDARPTGRPA